jgi:hypothetical protein
METALKAIFDSISKGINDTLDADSKGMLLESNAPISLMKSGEETFSFHLDANGNFRAEVEKYAGGITANCTVWFESPDVTYSLKITSTGGSPYEKHDVKINQKLDFKLKTKLIGNTKVTVEVSANAINMDCRGKIAYGF